jgi:hypothetical protein
MSHFEEGAKAFNEGVSLCSNPYARFSKPGERWHEGWKSEWWRTATWRPR